MAAVSEFFGSQLQRLPLLHGGHFEAVTRQLLRPFGPSAVPPSSATSLQPPQCSNFGADWARLPLIFIIVIVVFISEFSGSSLQLLRCRYFSGCVPCSGCAPTQSSVEQAAAGPSYACGYVLGYASVDSCFAAATSVQHLRCSPARSWDLHGSYFAAATSVRPLRGSAALSLEPDCSYIAVPLAEPVAMPPAAPPSTATALQLHQCTAGADWPGLMILTNMTFSSMTFVIMLRWLKPPAAAAAAATHCSGDRRLLHHDPRHRRDRLGRIDDLHHHDLRHHDAVADGDMLRWL